MKKVSYDRGRIIDAPPEVVACLWTNWEIYDGLLGGKFNIRRTGPTAWTGRHIFSANLELVSREAGLDSGKFVYIFSANLAGLPGKAVVTLRYSAGVSGVTSVEGRFENELKWPYTIAEPFVKNQITRVVDAVIEGGQVSCERISKTYDQVQKELPDEYLKVIDSYLDTAKRLRIQSFENPLLLPSVSPSSDAAGRPFQTPDLREIQRVVDELQTKGEPKSPRLLQELKSLIATPDDVAKLLYARRVLETIVIELCDEHLKRARGTEPLDSVLDRLYKQSLIPEHVVASMKNVNRMGTFGAHPKEFSPKQVREAFASLSSVLDWYLDHFTSGEI